MQETEAITMEGIYKSFGGVPVLVDVDFHLDKGTIHALCGGNGAGKSTLMKIMTGVFKHDSGTVKVNGEVATINSPIDAKSYGINMVFQEMSLIPTLTVTENIYLTHEIKKGLFEDRKKMQKAAKEFLEDLGIDVDVNAYIKDLPVGACQLVEIAKAMSLDSKVLVMDEPTTSLTEYETNILFRIMRNLKQRGVSIVYISHRMQEVLDIADKIAVLRDGKIVVDKDRDQHDMDSLIDYIIGKKVEQQMQYRKREGAILDENLLEVRDLSVDGRIKNIAFNVKKGEVLGLVGLMGSGRTEIVEVLSGLRSQGNANITLDGKEISIKNVDDAIKKGITLVPEDRRREGLVLMHSVMDNICAPNFGRLKNGIFLNKKKCKDITKECIDDFVIKADGVDTIVFNMSGGNQQKVVISKWFKTDPTLLLLDEPTAGVDIGAKGEIMNIIRHFVSKEKGVIFISSELAEVLGICDRIIVLKDGEIKAEYDREELKSEEELQHAVQH